MAYNKDYVLAHCASSSGYNGEGVININAERLFNLMDSHAQNGRGELKRKCKDMLNEMNTNNWRIAAGLHAGGLGGGGRSADPRMHITLTLRSGTYHVRFSGSGRQLQLMEITP
ncbi:MAG TPA: hypothetical protein VK872_09705 [Draconibacterium sp.]|nr:hypothetical protein [Draconibacterium sp.]